jgi:DNA-binding response OmpR family regulator
MQKGAMLVVDDERSIRLAVSRSLESLGMPVQTAVNGEEALEKLRVEEFSLIFLDLKMPGMDGMDVLRKIRETRPRTRVIIITAHGTIESAVDAMKLGAVDFIQKPFSPDEIRTLARRVLERDALDEEGVDFQVLVALARQRMVEQRFGEAGEIARRAISADPTRPEGYNLLGALHEMRGQHADAQKLYRAAVDVDPTYRPGWSNLERTTSWDKPGRIDLGGDEDAGTSPDTHDAGARDER